MAISSLQAAGKKEKSNYSKTYFLMSSSLMAQKQLKPRMCFSPSQMRDWNSLDTPTIVRFTPSLEALSIKGPSCAKLLSPTSVIMMILFSQPVPPCFQNQPVISFSDFSKPRLMVVPPRVLILASSSYSSYLRSFFMVTGSIVSASVSNTTIPTASFGLSFDTNILMASTDSSSLVLRSFSRTPLRGPPIDPEMSRQMIELSLLSSLSLPSLSPFMNSTRKSLMLGSTVLWENWQRAQPNLRSAGLSVCFPASNLSSLNTPSKLIWLTSGSPPALTLSEKPRELPAQKYFFMCVYSFIIKQI